jgi:hypothetical protein
MKLNLRVFSTVMIASICGSNLFAKILGTSAIRPVVMDKILFLNDKIEDLPLKGLPQVTMGKEGLEGCRSNSASYPVDIKDTSAAKVAFDGKKEILFGESGALCETELKAFQSYYISETPIKNCAKNSVLENFNLIKTSAKIPHLLGELKKTCDGALWSRDADLAPPFFLQQVILAPFELRELMDVVRTTSLYQDRAKKYSEAKDLYLERIKTDESPVSQKQEQPGNWEYYDQGKPIITAFYSPKDKHLIAEIQLAGGHDDCTYESPLRFSTSLHVIFRKDAGTSSQWRIVSDDIRDELGRVIAAADLNLDGKEELIFENRSFGINIISDEAGSFSVIEESPYIIRDDFSDEFCGC